MCYHIPSCYLFLLIHPRNTFELMKQMHCFQELDGARLVISLSESGQSERDDDADSLSELALRVQDDDEVRNFTFNIHIFPPNKIKCYGVWGRCITIQTDLPYFLHIPNPLYIYTLNSNTFKQYLTLRDRY